MDCHREEWANRLQEICNDCEDDIQGICHVLSQKIEDFQRKKSELITAMENTERHNKVPQAIETSLKDMIPNSLLQVVGLACMTRAPVLEDVTAPACPFPPVSAPDVLEEVSTNRHIFSKPMTAEEIQKMASFSNLGSEDTLETNRITSRPSLKENIQPTRQPIQARPAKHQLTMAELFTPNPPGLFSITDPKVNENTMKNSTGRTKTKPEIPPISHRPSVKPTLPPKSGPVAEWEVEGLEYIFQYKPFGAGWYVLRCPQGQDHPVRFKSHPLLGRGSGLKHFNQDVCAYHDRTRTYNEEAMMAEFACRVEDDDGDDVTDDWAKESNEMLIEKLLKAKAPKSKSQDYTYADSSSQFDSQDAVSPPLSSSLNSCLSREDSDNLESL